MTAHYQKSLLRLSANNQPINPMLLEQPVQEIDLESRLDALRIALGDLPPDQSKKLVEAIESATSRKIAESCQGVNWPGGDYCDVEFYVTGRCDPRITLSIASVPGSNDRTEALALLGLDAAKALRDSLSRAIAQSEAQVSTTNQF